MTGPRLLTFAEAVAEIAKAAGLEVRYLQITPEQFLATWTEEGLPSDFAAALTEVLSTVLDGRNSYLTNGVSRAGTATAGLRRVRAGHRSHRRLERVRRTTCWSCLGA